MFKCDICGGKAFSNNDALAQHRTGKKHIDKHANATFKPISLQPEATKAISLQALSEENKIAYTKWVTKVEQEAREAILRER